MKKDVIKKLRDVGLITDEICTTLTIKNKNGIYDVGAIMEDFTKEQVQKAALEVLEKEVKEAFNSSRLKKHECSVWNCTGDEKTYLNAAEYFETQVKPRYTK